MDQDRLQYLINRHQSNQATPEEGEELDNWFHSWNPGSHSMDAWLREQGGHENLSSLLYNDLRERMAPATHRGISWMWYRVAAAAAVLAVILLVVFNNRPAPATGITQKQDTATGNTAGSLIKPGGDKAILVLADGRVIDLGDSQTGTIATQSNTSVEQVQQGKIAYKTGVKEEPQAPLTYNTLRTPRGGMYKLTLSDGTEVTLDASSSITYPVVFRGEARQVEITGQVYFDVIHDERRPFFVKAKGQTIVDLGTAFNISAYDDDNDLRVTLASGKAAIRTAARSVDLVPGQQARVVDGQSSIAIRQVNVADIVAWKEGWFMFRNEPIEAVMKQAARWYDIEVEYQGDKFSKELGGSISKYKDISELLQNLQITGGIRYRIVGKKVIIYQ